MASRTVPQRAILEILSGAVFLAFTGCAELGDAWEEVGRDVGALFETPSAGATKEEQRRAQAAYERALSAEAAGDQAAGAKHLREAAELGHAQAAYALGLAYIEGSGVPEDLELSAKWINRAADLGDPGAEFLVGSSFYAGIGVEQDIPRGLSFLERAAVQGHSKAQFLLGQAYVDGVGVRENAQWAARWYGKAARGGHPQAQYALGVMFASGLGVPKSPRRAYQWFSIAAANGDEKAAALREAISSRLAPAALAMADAKAAHFSAKKSIGYSDAATVMYVQIRLRALGYDAGPVDGIAGPKTRTAIEAFQSSERLTVDGELSRSLVEDLFERHMPRGA
jgi:localization factor PodJL